MDLAIWIVTGLLAGIFAIAGLVKVFSTKDKMKEQGMAYVEDYSDQTIKLIGAIEILAALGLILPGVLGLATILVPLAASGLAFIMIGAIIVHMRRNENNEVPKNLVLLAAALFVAVTRLGPYQL